MQIVYGFIYFFTIVMTCAVVALAVFLIPKARTLLVQLTRKHTTVFQSDFFRYAMMLAFAIIGLVLGESVYTYTVLNNHFSRSKH